MLKSNTEFVSLDVFYTLTHTHVSDINSHGELIFRARFLRSSFCDSVALVYFFSRRSTKPVLFLCCFVIWKRLYSLIAADAKNYKGAEISFTKKKAAAVKQLISECRCIEGLTENQIEISTMFDMNKIYLQFDERLLLLLLFVLYFVSFILSFYLIFFSLWYLLSWRPQCIDLERCVLFFSFFLHWQRLFVLVIFF